jgi:hypothetical protein
VVVDVNGPGERGHAHELRHVSWAHGHVTVVWLVHLLKRHIGSWPWHGSFVTAIPIHRMHHLFSRARSESMFMRVDLGVLVALAL